jgi:hypothetical protein
VREIKGEIDLLVWSIIQVLLIVFLFVVLPELDRRDAQALLNGRPMPSQGSCLPWIGLLVLLLVLLTLLGLFFGKST